MKKNDLIIMAIGLLLALAVYGGLQLNNLRHRDEEKMLEVYIDGVLEEAFPLSEDGVHTYETERGTNVIQISGGTAAIVDANCPTRSCIEDGAIANVNESVVCLPHHFHITVSGKEEVEVDAVSQ